MGVFGAPRGDREGAEGSLSGWASTACVKDPTSAPGEQKEHESEGIDVEMMRSRGGKKGTKHTTHSQTRVAAVSMQQLCLEAWS